MRNTSLRDLAWVIGQFLLIIATVVASIIEITRSRSRPLAGLRWPFRIAGIGLLAAAAGIASSASRELGESLRVAPTPADDGRLVETGIYGVVRHPLYLTVVIAAGAWALFTRTGSSLIGIAAAFVFFQGKARYEEQLLDQRYPGYAGYRTRVPSRIIPFRR